ncbi:MAG: hypothetical protein MUF31_10195 [Akkermansiaceae bacterium]|jgi:hypothetical protein|nr:hypothetical protein [Akkermansiaceae bacterium]
MKFDRRGRLRYEPEQKAALIEADAASGLSGPKFAPPGLETGEASSYPIHPIHPGPTSRLFLFVPFDPFVVPHFINLSVFSEYSVVPSSAAGSG